MDFIVCRDNADSLQHHGIRGQRWGIRRFQNEDRTWTEAGKDRYNDGPGGGSSSGGSSGSSSGSSWSVKSSVKNAAEKVKSGVSGVKDKAVSTAKEVKDKTVDAAQDVKDKAEDTINEAKKEPTQEELDARAARRKDIAKKVAIGIGITAAVVGTAFVAKYAHDKIKDLKSINSGDFADKLSASLDLEFKAMDKDRTYNMEQQGLLRKSKGGMSGVLQRTDPGSIYRSQESLRLDKDFESGSIDRGKKHVYTVLNNAVDRYLKKSLSEGETIRESKYYSREMTSKEVEQARQFASTYAGYLMRDYGDNIQEEYLSDVARDFVRSFARRAA